MAFGTFILGSVRFEISNVQSAVEYSGGQDNSRLVVTYRVPWSSRHKARLLLLGSTNIREGFGRKYLARIPPHKWIEDEVNQVYCKAVTRIVGLEPVDEPDCYVFALITALYEDLPYDVATDADMGAVPDESTFLRMVEYGDREAKSTVINAMGAGFVYKERVVPPQPERPSVRPYLLGTPFREIEEHIEIIWHQVPVVNSPDSIITGMLNKINNAPFYNRTVYTMMLIGAKPIRTRLPNMTRAYNWKFTFAHKPTGWHKAPDISDSLRYLEIVSARDNTKFMFETGDFATLFRPV